jgi:L-histidine N-alpha-methyltransferase
MRPEPGLMRAERRLTPSATPTSATAPTGAARDFAEDVRHFLLQGQRQLPSRYLYDDLGSALFEAICRLPWYPLTRAEMRLLEAHAGDILDADVTTIVELGPGSGAKLSALIAGAGTHRGPLDLHLVDISGSALAEAGRTLEEHAGVRVVPHQTTYEAGLVEIGLAPSAGRRLALFLGSNIGNFDPPGRDVFLSAIRASLAPGDGLLIGVDLVKPAANLVLAYDDPLGVTAAFNRNLLQRINRELGGDFDLEGFDHRAVWNESASRIEMHLRSRWRQRVSILGAGVTFVIDPGETIWTESSYKYRPDEIESMLLRAGFGLRAQWFDAAAGFALTLAEAV